MKVTIDPRFQINYSSYYIQGLMDVVGKKNVRFGIIEGIGVFSLDDFRKGMAVLLQEGNRDKHLFIDTWDSADVHPDYYRWSDVYAKINTRPRDNRLEKLCVIGPSFGIQLWNPIKTIFLAICNYWKARNAKGYSPSMKDYLLNYAYTFVRRVPLQRYARPCQEDKEYVFALNTLWYDELTHATTNWYRGRFARTCQRVFSQFEGGFYYIPSHGVEAQFPKYKEYLVEYKDLLIHRRVGMNEYLKKLQRSALVFNVPSVSGCHGWKLGEYLALGKVIVSMPLNNAMPEGWIDGITHIEVHEGGEMERVIRRLHEDPDLCARLKQGASRYYDQILVPQKVIMSLLQTLFADETDGNRSHL